MNESTKITCPKCNSDQISAQKKGFSAGKAVAGGVLTGGVGLLAGLHGKDRIEVYCLSCGCKWKPKDYEEVKAKHEENKGLENRQKFGGEFLRLYKVDRSEAEIFANKHGLLNSDIPTIDKLRNKIWNERIGGGIVMVVFLAFFVWLITQCAG